jgi:16S rRNA (adenine(1408)-N(1))-methyltransferase
VAGTPEELALEVTGIARTLTLLLPWGSLLRGIACPEPSTLSALRDLCQPDAELELVFSHGARDGVLDIALDEEHVRSALLPAYASAGLRVKHVARLDRAALARYPTTWARRLASGREREVWRTLLRPSGLPP